MKAKILKSKTKSKKPVTPKSVEPASAGILKDEFVLTKVVGIDGDTAKKAVTKMARSKTTEPDALPIENYTQKTEELEIKK